MGIQPERMEEGKVGHEHNQQYLAEGMEMVDLMRTQGALLEDDLLPELEGEGEGEGNLKIGEVHLGGWHPVHSDQMCPEE